MSRKEIVIFREILLKELVTESSKKQKIDRCNEEILAIGRQLTAHQEHKKKVLTEISLKGSEKSQLDRFRDQFDAEAARLNMRKDELLRRIEEINLQEVGSQVVVGSVEGPYTLRVGQQLDEATSSYILLQEGKIIDIVD